MSAIPSVSHAQFSIPTTAGKYFAKPMLATAQTDTADTVTISKAAQDALASSNASNEIDAQLAAIKAKDPISRTPDDVAFMQTNDPKLAANMYKINHNIPLTSAEIDYDQKTMGFEFIRIAQRRRESPVRQGRSQREPGSCGRHFRHRNDKDIGT